MAHLPDISATPVPLPTMPPAGSDLSLSAAGAETALSLPDAGMPPQPDQPAGTAPLAALATLVPGTLTTQPDTTSSVLSAAPTSVTTMTSHGATLPEPPSEPVDHPAMRVEDGTRSAESAAPGMTGVTSGGAPDRSPGTTIDASPLSGSAAPPVVAPAAVAARAPDAVSLLADGKPPSSPPPVALTDLPVAVATLARQGERTFEIRLDPAELGKIDVNLTIDRDGAVRTHIVVERPETVQVLRNDVARLEQALGESGLRADPGGIGISLRNGSGQNGQQGQSSAGQATASSQQAQDQPEPAMQQLPYRRALGLTQRLDLVL